MRRASRSVPDSAEKMVRDIRRATRRRPSAEDKIRIVLEGLRGEVSVAELCRALLRFQIGEVIGQFQAKLQRCTF